jgi:ABC-2 type transport system permease protein
MLGDILGFEWRYHTRQLTFPVVALVFAGMAAFFVGTGYGPANVNVNASYTVAQTLGLLSLFSVFLLTIFCTSAAMRDLEHGMAEIVFSTPVGKARYLAGRFIGAVATSLVVMSLAALVLMFAPFVVRVDPARLGSLHPLFYLWALLVFVLPNMVLIASVLFAIAALSRSTLATYMGAIGIYAAYLVTALLVDSPLMAGAAPPTPEGLARAAMLDPFGLSAFFEQTRYWTPAERDVRLVALTGRMLANRAVWSGFALAVLAATYARFSLRVEGGVKRRRDRGVSRSEVAPAVTYRPVAVATAARATPAAGIASSLRLELRHLLHGWTFRIFLVLWTVVITMQAIGEIGGGEYGTRLVPSTGVLLSAFHLPMLLLGTLGIVYYAAEMAWRERVVRFDALVDTTPAPGAVFYLGKVLALLALPFIMGAIAVVLGAVIQAMHGMRVVNPQLALGVLWYTAVPLALFAVGAMALQVVAPNRWIGLIAGLLFAMLSRQGASVGLEHPMLRFGAAPSVAYSEMDGFGPIAGSFSAFMLYWTCAALLLASLSALLWRRGVDPGIAERVRRLFASSGTRTRRLVAVIALPFVAIGGWLAWKTTMVEAWHGREARLAWSADYERSYRRLASVPQPSIVGVRIGVSIFPRERRAELGGELTLENRTVQPIDSVWIARPGGVKRAIVQMASSRAARHDDRLGMSVFSLSRSLMPGDRATVSYAVSVDRGSMRAGDFGYDVAENGSVLTSMLVPVVGYGPSHEIRDPAQRRAHGLTGEPTKIRALDYADTMAASPARPNAAWLTLDATISTDEDQTAFAPGRLAHSWRQDGRRHFRYVSDGPITPVYAFVSGRYAVRRATQDGVELSVWYHPAHARNVDTMLVAARRSLSMFGARYGAYPHRALRIVEVPSWSNFGAFALPGTILFTEDRGFLGEPRPGEVDLITRRIAHEVSHQWWPHRLDPADVSGASFLVETLAKNAEQLVIEAMHGPDAVADILRFDEDRYLAGRTGEREAEPPLLEVRGQEYLYYGKGGVVMSGLRDLLGAAAVDRAIARLLATRSGPNGAAVSLDFQRELLAAMDDRPESERALVRQWLGGITLYDVRVDTAVVTARPGGGYHARVDLTAVKSIRAGASEPDVLLDGEAIGVALLGGSPRHSIFVGTVPFTRGRARLMLDLPTKPLYVVADPFVRRIDRERSNNRKRFVD